MCLEEGAIGVKSPEALSRTLGRPRAAWCGPRQVAGQGPEGGEARGQEFLVPWGALSRDLDMFAQGQ